MDAIRLTPELERPGREIVSGEWLQHGSADWLTCSIYSPLVPLHVLDPGFEFVQNSFIHAEIGFGPFNFSAYKTGFFQNFQVLAYGGLGKREYVDNFSTDTGIALDQVFNNFNAGRMAEGFADV